MIKAKSIFFGCDYSNGITLFFFFSPNLEIEIEKTPYKGEILHESYIKITKRNMSLMSPILREKERETKKCVLLLKSEYFQSIFQRR